MDPAPEDVTLGRLEDQIAWYDRHSRGSQRAFKYFKVCTIVAAALIPALAGNEQLHWATASLGVFIVIVEGLQQLYQFQTNWITYRSACEGLKHEKYLYLAKAGVYCTVADPHALLAERIESLVSQENTKWASATQEKETKAPSKST